jgi:hypothetical protein
MLMIFGLCCLFGLAISNVESKPFGGFGDTLTKFGDIMSQSINDIKDTQLYQGFEERVRQGGDKLNEIRKDVKQGVDRAFCIGKVAWKYDLGPQDSNTLCEITFNTPDLIYLYAAVAVILSLIVVCCCCSLCCACCCL